MTPALARRVVVTVHENHITDNYFRGLVAYGANVATNWPLSPNPPRADQPHYCHAYVDWLRGQSDVRHRHRLGDWSGRRWLGRGSRVLKGGGTLPPPHHDPLPKQPHPPV